jgi:hypothetical protein
MNVADRKRLAFHFERAEAIGTELVVGTLFTVYARARGYMVREDGIERYQEARVRFAHSRPCAGCHRQVALVGDVAANVVGHVFCHDCHDTAEAINAEQRVLRERRELRRMRGRTIGRSP